MNNNPPNPVLDYLMKNRPLTLTLNREAAQILGLIVHVAIATQAVSPHGKVWALSLIEALNEYKAGNQTNFDLSNVISIISENLQ